MGMASERTPWGIPDLPVSPDTVDPAIYGLVLAMNVKGVCLTRASCQGHRRPLSSPYVMFSAQPLFVSRLASLLDQKAEDLFGYWVIDGGRFRISPGRRPEFCHRLVIEGFGLHGHVFSFLSRVLPRIPVSFWWPTTRARLDRDFLALSKLVDEAVSSLSD